ncbi:MAG: TolC family protein [Mucinivorans sp.]
MKYLVNYNLKVLFYGLLFFWGQQVVAQESSRELSIDELFEIGIENSLQLKASKIEEVIADEQQRTALTERLPSLQIGLSAGLIGQPTIFEQGLSHPTYPTTPNWSQSYGIVLNQPIYQGGRIQYNIQKADIQKQVAALASTNNQAKVKLLLLEQYVALFSYYKECDVLRENITESERRLTDIRRMRKEGVLTLNDELRSELQLTNYKLSLQEAQHSITLASIRLDIMLGLDESLLIIPDTIILHQKFDLQDYESYLSEAYENYPDMQIARRNTQMAQTQTKLAKADYLPSLSLHADNTLARPMSTSLADVYNNRWNIGLSLSYNLSSIYQNRHRVHQAQQMVQLSRNTQEQLKQDIRLQIRSAYIRHQEALNRVEVLTLSVQQAQENYRIVQNRYLNQLSILTDLLDASSVRLTAQLQLTTARSQTIYTYYELQRACGNL